MRINIAFVSKENDSYYMYHNLDVTQWIPHKELAFVTSK